MGWRLRPPSVMGVEAPPTQCPWGGGSRPPSGRTCSSTIQPTRSVATMTDPDFSTAPLDVRSHRRRRRRHVRPCTDFASRGCVSTASRRAPEWAARGTFNRYPGARCDVESFDYSLLVLRRFATGLGLEREVRRAAGDPVLPRSRRRSLRPAQWVHFRYPCPERTVRRGTRRRGECTPTVGHDVTSRFVVCATGSLSTANVPNIAGRETFGGEVFHTGFWPHEGVDFTGKRVGVIGHRIVGHPVRSVDRRAGRSPLRVPAVRELQCAGGKPRLSMTNDAQRSRPTTPSVERCPSAVAVDLRSFRILAARSRCPRPRGTRPTRSGGSSAVFCFAKNLRRPDQQHRRQRDGGCVCRGQDQIGGRRSGHRRPADPERPPQSGPSGSWTDTDYYQSYNRDNVSLVDLKSAPIEAIDEAGIKNNRLALRTRRIGVRPPVSMR